MCKSFSLSSALLLIAILLSACHFSFFSISFEGRSSYAQIAEELRNQGKNKEAIENYELHIQDRLNNPNKPNDENPYFYKLMIGDIYLDLKEPENAAKSYTEAKEKGVNHYLVSERFRFIARYYEKQGELEKAFAALRQFRDLDPLMYDMEADRIHKLIIKKEDEKEKKH